MRRTAVGRPVIGRVVVVHAAWLFVNQATIARFDIAIAAATIAVGIAALGAHAAIAPDHAMEEVFDRRGMLTVLATSAASNEHDKHTGAQDNPSERAFATRSDRDYHAGLHATLNKKRILPKLLPKTAPQNMERRFGCGIRTGAAARPVGKN